MGRRKIWTPDYVLSSLEWLHFWGCYLNPQYLYSHYQRLYENTLIFFDSVENALGQLGIDYVQVKKDYKIPLVIWSADYVLTSIDWLHFWGIRLDTTNIVRHYNRLYVKAIEFFGSWDNALLAAGLDPKKIKLYREHSDEGIIKGIREIKKRGEPLNALYIKNAYPYLYEAAMRRGGWGSWVEKAGFDYIEESVQVRTKTYAKKISPQKLQEIREKYSTQEALPK